MENISIPKRLKKYSEKRYGFSIMRISIVVTYLLVSLFLIIAINMLSGAAKYALAALLLCMWIVYLRFLRTDEMIERNSLIVRYLIRSLSGQTVAAKYIANLPFMEELFPLVSVHKNGLIEFKNRFYGLLMRVDPERIADDDLPQHIGKVKSLVDSLHGVLTLKTYACSRSAAVKPLEQQLIKTMNSTENEGEKTQPQKEHLYELYREVHENNAPVIEWQFFVFLGLGAQPSLEDAEIARQAHFPGVYDRLVKAGMHVTQLTDDYDIALAYRQCITQERIE